MGGGEFFGEITGGHGWIIGERGKFVIGEIF
jgi:hypothetical protein